MRGRREVVKDEDVGEERAVGAMMRSYLVGGVNVGLCCVKNLGLKDAPRRLGYIGNLLQVI